MTGLPSFGVTAMMAGKGVAAQGTALGRDGRVHVACDADGQVWVGGDCVAVVRGEVTL